jgi:hypothetical protein
MASRRVTGKSLHLPVRESVSFCDRQCGRVAFMSSSAVRQHQNSRLTNQRTGSLQRDCSRPTITFYRISSLTLGFSYLPHERQTPLKAKIFGASS